MNWGAVGLLACTVALGASSANAQLMRGPEVIVASDFDAPPSYDESGPALPRYAPPPYASEPRYAPSPYAGESYGPSAYASPMLPPGEVVRIARQNGFSPLGAPQQRGFVYRLPVLSPEGDDGRLVIDARSGRIIRFLPAMEYGDRFGFGKAYASAPVGALPPKNPPGATLRPPSAVPRISAPATVAALPKPAAPRGADIRQAVPPAPPAALAAIAPTPQPAAPPPAMMAIPPAQGLD